MAYKERLGSLSKEAKVARKLSDEEIADYADELWTDIVEVLDKWEKANYDISFADVGKIRKKAFQTLLR